MTVKEFDKLNVSGCMYCLVDTDRAGYMTADAFYTADRNITTRFYGDWIVGGFEPCGKTMIRLYIARAEV